MPGQVQLTREGYDRLEQAPEKERRCLEEMSISMASTVDDAMDSEHHGVLSLASGVSVRA